MIQKIYEVDPLICPKCQGRMKLIAFIGDQKVIEKILKHLELREMKAGLRAKVKVPFITISNDDLNSPDPFSIPPIYPDTEYPMDSYTTSKPHRATPLVTISAINALFLDS
jgi:hypothetical protein